MTTKKLKNPNPLRNYDFAWKFKLKVCLPLFSVLLLFDWITKIVVQTTMSQGETKEFIPGFLKFEYIINPGSAYGFNAGNLALAISLATIITVVLIVAFVFVNAHAWLPGMAVAIAGSLGNLVARSWAPAVQGGNFDGVKGGVVDFLRWGFGFANADSYIFNLADVWVICGIIMVVLGAIIGWIMYGVKKHQENQKEASLTVDVTIEAKSRTKGKAFVYKDEEKLTPQQLKLYRKELKAYQKMKKIEEKKDAKNSRRNSPKDSSR